MRRSRAASWNGRVASAHSPPRRTAPTTTEQSPRPPAPRRPFRTNRAVGTPASCRRSESRGVACRSTPVHDQERAELSLLRAVRRSFVSMRCVVQVRLDRGFCACEPARDLRDRQLLLVAIVPGQRSCTPSLLHTVSGYPLHDHVAWRPSDELDSRSAGSGLRHRSASALRRGRSVRPRPLLLPLVRSGCVRTVDSAEIGSCCATEHKSRCDRRHFWIASATGHLVDADRESAPLLKAARRPIVAGMPGRCRSARRRAARPRQEEAVLCQAVLVGVADGLAAVAGAGFVEDSVDVGLDGCVAEDELVCDLAVGEAGRD